MNSLPPARATSSFKPLLYAFQFERVACAAKMPTNLIEDNCKLIPWVFFQIMYYDKQAQVCDNQTLLW